MIKIWADSLDRNFNEPRESFFFAKDIVNFNSDFELAESANRADVIIIPQYSNNYINNLIGNYVFDIWKAEYLFNLKKPIIVVNTGGGTPKEWKDLKLPIFDYIYGEVAKNVIIFSTECYTWHREYLPESVKYLPYDYTGFVKYGMGIREIPPLQSKKYYLKRTLGTAVAMNSYPPTRDRLWDMVHEQNEWEHFSYRTIPNGNQERIDWGIMASNLLNSKIGFAPDGATGKTERHLYVPSYTAMMKQQDTYLEFPYAWIDGKNCIEMVHDFQDGYNEENETTCHMNGHSIRELNKEKTKAKIVEYLNNPDKLYEIYVNGWHNDENYRLPNYIKNYIGETIKNNI